MRFLPTLTTLAIGSSFIWAGDPGRRRRAKNDETNPMRFLPTLPTLAIGTTWVWAGLLKILGFRRFLGLLDWRNLLRYPRRRKEPIVTEGSENGYACLSESQGGPSVSQPTPGARANVSK
jgi:hypothetical protein